MKIRPLTLSHEDENPIWLSTRSAWDQEQFQALMLNIVFTWSKQGLNVIFTWPKQGPLKYIDMVTKLNCWDIADMTEESNIKKNKQEDTLSK